MISRTQSGIPADDEFPPPRILGLLGGGPALAIFALLCAERVGALVERLAESPLVRSTTRSAIQAGWIAVASQSDSKAIRQAIADIDEIISYADGDLGKYHGYLDDALSVIAYALEVVHGGDDAAAVNVIKRCREISFQIAQQLWPRMSLNELSSSQVMHEEVMRQLRDANKAAVLDRVVSSDRITGLREAAFAEGDAMADLICGQKASSGRDADAEEQPTLF